MMKLLVTLFVALMGTVLSAEPVVHEVASIEDVEALPDGVTHVKCDRGVDNDVLKALGGVATLESLDLNHCRAIDHDGLAHLSGLKLKALDLGMCRQLKDPGLAEVGKLASLERLNLHQGILYTDAGMEPLSELKDLRSINIGMFWEASGAGLEHVLSLPKLTELELRLNNWVSDEVLSRIVEAKPGLKKLNLRECRGYGLEGLAHVAKLKELRWLDVGGYKSMNVEMLDEIAKIEQLEHLDLIMAGLFEDAELVRLKPLKNLKFLGLETVPLLTGECFEEWQPPQLEHLEFKNNSLNSDGMRAIAGLKCLKRLDVWDFMADEVNSEDISELAKLEELECLSLWLPGVADETLKNLAAMNSLRELELTDTERVTDKGLTYLAEMQSAERISLMQCDNVSDAALEKLRKELPDCEVVREKDPY